MKKYLQRFYAAALEVPSATQEVKASAFSQGFLDGDFFKSLAKKFVSKFDALLTRVAKYINMEDAQAAKKESRREKRKEEKEETPNRGSGQEVPLPTESEHSIHSTRTNHPGPYGYRRKRPIGSTQVMEGRTPPSQI
ncbi:UNVERIFIED_CONTAM: hypothetical protein Sangu_2989100 [Sesamum angustifolium]|uniref:Uncharacterized protein n=1 Tax=Sesamum angustifolium TaxID=2727405 RepID=A0AAW2KNG0_9LAMI